MSTNFKRNDVQVYIENAQNCFDLKKWNSYKHLFLSWEITEADIALLTNCLESDLTSYFFKAFESFSQSLIDIKNGKYSWAIVKLYYTIFYLLRCDILLSNRLIVRCSGLYYSELIQGSKFVQYSKGNVRGDHQLTISLAKDLQKAGMLQDSILDNNIEEVDAYTWLMHNRERINYQQKNFAEPEVDSVFNHLMSYFEESKVKDLFTFYNSKDYSICFDLDHSVLAIPYKKILQIWKKANGKIDFKGQYKRKIATTLKEIRDLNISKVELSEILR